jgi:hypothetical protein
MAQQSLCVMYLLEQVNDYDRKPLAHRDHLHKISLRIPIFNHLVSYRIRNRLSLINLAGVSVHSKRHHRPLTANRTHKKMNPTLTPIHKPH